MEKHRVLNNRKREKETAILVGVQTASEPFWKAEECLAELEQLAVSAGAHVAQSVLQSRTTPDNAYFIGKGKALHVASLAERLETGVVIFDCELSPAQQRNLEDLIGSRVIDRTQLILDIFAQRARSREGKIQVELAQLEYLLPRLTGHGVTMSRVGGGVGARWGPGETKLETDRRRIRDRIAKLKRDLNAIRLHRNVQRKRRLRQNVPNLAIVGYTNAGKSTLLNAVAGANAFVEDKLFATLDPLSRQVELRDGRIVVFTDTVGFIRKLPHSLVAAFRATLEEVTYADAIVLVLDASTRYWDEHRIVARQVLRELGAAEKPTITVFNKTDLLADPALAESLKNRVSRSVCLSAINGENITDLLNLTGEVLSSQRQTVKLAVPQNRGEITAIIHEKGNVLATEYEDGLAVFTVELDKPTAAKLREFIRDT